MVREDKHGVCQHVCWSWFAVGRRAHHEHSLLIQTNAGGDDPNLCLKGSFFCGSLSLSPAVCNEQQTSAVSAVCGDRPSAAVKAVQRLTHRSSPLAVDLASNSCTHAPCRHQPPPCSALGVSTLSYAWWMFTNKDLQHSNIFDFFFNSMIKRRYEKGGLDETRLEMAQVSLSPNEQLDKLADCLLYSPIFSGEAGQGVYRRT